MCIFSYEYKVITQILITQYISFLSIQIMFKIYWQWCYWDVIAIETMMLIFVVQYIFCYLYNYEASSSGLGAYSLIRPSIQQPSCLCCFPWQDETLVVLVICSNTSFVHGLFKDVLFHIVIQTVNSKHIP